jgi:hypothetical protein
MSSRIADLETDLNHFDARVRARALAELVALAERGDVPFEPERNVANMHCHTFFSFNAYGYSPTGLAWLARRRGFRLMGIVDFDVLDGVDEFLAACDVVGVRGSAGLETRIYIPEFATREINSPGEPGIFYHMGIGFTSSRTPEEAAPILAAMRERAARRNRSIVRRVNEHLAPVQIDYERDVLPLTPGGNPTERHIVAAYVRAAERAVPDPLGFWGEKLGVSETGFFEKNPVSSPAFHDLIRARLMAQPGDVPHRRGGQRADPGLRRAPLRHLARRHLRRRAGRRGVVEPADRQRHRRPQLHPRPLLERRRPGG